MQQLQRDPRLFQETRSANGAERTIRQDQQAPLAPVRPRRTLHSGRKAAIRGKGNGCLRAEAPSAATSAIPSILSRHPSHRTLTDFQTRRSQSFRLFAREPLRLGAWF